MYLRHIILILIIFSSFNFVFSQNKVDSLKKLLSAKTEKNSAEILNQLAYQLSASDMDESKKFALKALKISKKFKNTAQIAIAYSNIGDTYYFSGKQDSSVYFYKKAINYKNQINDSSGIALLSNYIGIAYYEQGYYKNALKYYNKSLKIYQKLKNKDGEAGALGNIGVIYKYWGNTEKALENYNKALDILKQSNNLKGSAGILVNIGDILKNNSEYKSAIKKYQEAQILYDSINNKFGVANAVNNIGIVYYEWENYDKAIEYFNNSLKLNNEIGNKRGLVDAQSNIGLIYMDKENYDKALEYFKTALSISLEINKTKAVSNCYNNMGMIYIQKDDYLKAIECYEKSLAIEKKSENKKGISGAMRNIGELHLSLGNYTQAKKYLNNSLELAIEFNIVNLQIKNFLSLYKLYKKMGNPNKALECFETFYALSDSVFSAEKHKQFNELQTKYETEKKEQQIKEQQITIEKEIAESDKKAAQRNIVVLGLGLMTILVFVIFRSYKRKKKDNALLVEQKIEISEKNEELNQQNEEIAAQRDEIEHQRNFVVSQRDKIAEQKLKITDSIKYASRIQAAIMPPVDVLKDILPNYFILNKPRDIVSGDFYWVGKKDNHLIIAVADCTGHGVPGAFMSMLGIAFLNEIVNKSRIHNAAEILNRLKKQVIFSLHQTGSETEAKDGMDIAVCLIDLNKKIISFAGANNPLYLIRNNELIEVKGDKMPVGIRVRAKNEFTDNEIEIEKNDIIYLFSDGYIDQFGGPETTKFKSKYFKEKLLQIHKLPIQEQCSDLDKTIEDWKGDLQQLDDILVMGIELG